MKRLNEKELQKKRAKGLCFRCDGKWSIGYKCQRKELSVLLTPQDEGSGEDDSGTMELEGEVETGQQKVLPKISLNSVVDFTSLKTFKVRGEVNGSPVVVMIDPGATHKFIALALHVVDKLGIECNPTKQFGLFRYRGVGPE